MSTLREAAQAVVDAFADPNARANLRGHWLHLSYCITALRAALKQEETLQVMPTKIMGPNLEEILNGAGFYRRTSLGVPAIMDLMDKVPRGTFAGTDAGNAMRIWLLAALETEKAHGIKGVKE
jgi:hypothetical protein